VTTSETPRNSPAPRNKSCGWCSLLCRIVSVADRRCSRSRDGVLINRRTHYCKHKCLRRQRLLDGSLFQEFALSTHVQHPLSHRLVVADVATKMLLLRLTRRLVARRRHVEGLRLLRALPRPTRRRSSVALQVIIMQATIHCMSFHLCTMPPEHIDICIMVVVVQCAATSRA